MKRQNPKLRFACLLLGCTFLFAGCKKEVPVEEPVILDYQHITWQTDLVTSVGPRSMDDNSFYIEHTNEDGSKTYYDLGTPTTEDGNYYYIAGTEDIPTLFLGQGDRLLYHSYTQLLQNIYFTRLEDLGYTIGIYDINSIENGRCFLDTGSDHVLPLCKDAGFLEEQEADNILIDEMGIALPSGYVFGEPAECTYTCSLKDGTLSFYDGLELATTRNISDYDMSEFNESAPELSDIHYPKLTSEGLNRGILFGLEKNQKYHLEFYSGTYYTTSDMVANIHIFSEKERFHTNEYNLLQGTLFEVKLPNLENGIYSIGTTPTNYRTIRVVNESEYSIDDIFDTYTLPTNVFGIVSDVGKYNQLYINPNMEDGAVTASIDENKRSNYFFQYQTESADEKYDNGISWYYKKGDIELGRILDRHADFFVNNKATLCTVVELEVLDELYYIVRQFGLEESNDIPTGNEYSIPLMETGTVHVETYDTADFLFLYDTEIGITPKKGTYGIFAINPTTTESPVMSEETVPSEGIVETESVNENTSSDSELIIEPTIVPEEVEE